MTADYVHGAAATTASMQATAAIATHTHIRTCMRAYSSNLQLQVPTWVPGTNQGSYSTYSVCNQLRIYPCLYIAISTTAHDELLERE